MSKNFPTKRLEVINKLDTVIIDEVSMVRADLMDGVDYSLRLNRSVDKPFGGVQMVFVGDLYQLPPVVPRELAMFFDDQKGRYKGPWFFKSEAIRGKDMFYESLKFIELTRIFRQDEEAQKPFIAILNSLRVNDINDEQLALLNTRRKLGWKPEPGEVRLTVCTKNDYADDTNNRKLQELPARERIYGAEIKIIKEGKEKINMSLFPTEPQLKLKKGAQKRGRVRG